MNNHSLSQIFSDKTAVSNIFKYLKVKLYNEMVTNNVVVMRF